MSELDNFTIVLVDPLYGGNMGSVLRSMANFGLKDLRVVRPAEGIFDDPTLKHMAREAGFSIFKSIRVYEKLTEAIADIETAMAFTTRVGKKRSDLMALRPAVEHVFGNSPGTKIAGVFGSEDKGLSNEDLEKCHLMVQIQTSKEFRSLNLSHAVTLFCHEVFTKNLEISNTCERTRKPATVTEMEGMYGHIEKVLARVGFFEEETPDRMMSEMRRIISRRLPTPRDISIVRGSLSKIELALDGKIPVK